MLLLKNLALCGVFRFRRRKRTNETPPSLTGQNQYPILHALLTLVFWRIYAEGGFWSSVFGLGRGRGCW